MWDDDLCVETAFGPGLVVLMYAMLGSLQRAPAVMRSSALFSIMGRFLAVMPQPSCLRPW